MHYLDNISMSMRIFHWKFGVIMPSCSHCVHNWLFMNYLYSDGKNCNSHLCSHALTVFWSRISYNLFVISNISFFISCSDLIWSRMFSGFFFAKSVSEGGDLYGIWQISGGSKKIRRFLKKLAIFLKKNKVFFLFDLLFLGEQDFTYVRAALYVCTCRRYLLCIIWYSFFIPHLFSFLYCIFAKKECNLNSMRILFYCDTVFSFGGVQRV